MDHKHLTTDGLSSIILNLTFASVVFTTDVFLMHVASVEFINRNGKIGRVYV